MNRFPHTFLAIFTSPALDPFLRVDFFCLQILSAIIGQIFVINRRQKNGHGHQESKRGKRQKNRPGCMALAFLQLHYPCAATAKKGTFLGRVEQGIFGGIQLKGIRIVISEVEDVGVEESFVSKIGIRGTRILCTRNRSGSFTVTIVIVEEAPYIENGFIADRTTDIVVEGDFMVAEILGCYISNLGACVGTLRIVSIGEINTERRSTP